MNQIKKGSLVETSAQPILLAFPKANNFTTSNETEPEAVYRFIPSTDQQVQFILSDLSADLDIFVLEDNCCA